MGWMDAPEVGQQPQGWASAPEEQPFTVVATTKDGGRILRHPDGKLGFTSPGYSTGDQEVIQRILQGATPADAQSYRDVSEGGALGAGARSVLQGLTFGGGDEVVAAGASLLGPNSYETELARERMRLEKGRDKHAAVSAVGEIGGAVALPIGTIASAASLPVRIAYSAAQGAGLAGLYGFLSGEGDNRVQNGLDNAKWGGAIGAAIPAIGGVIQKALDRRATSKAISGAARGAPSSEELRAAGNAAYKAIDDANVQIKPQAFDATRSKIRDALRSNTGFDELPGPGSLTPNSARTMQIMDAAGDRMAAEPTAALPFSSLDQMRRQAGAAAGNVTNKTDAKAGMEIISGLDDFVGRLGPDDVVSGDVDALKALVPQARETWGKMSRSQLVDDAIRAGNENYLSGPSSGIRNQFKRILNNKKLARGFSEGERAAMQRVVNGTAGEQILNLLGGGLGQLGQIGAGLGLGGPVGALAGAATAAASRKASGAMSNRSAEIARAVVANGTLKSLPKSDPAVRGLIEQLLRRGTAAALPK